MNNNPKKLNLFLRASVFDFLCVLVVSVCLTMAVSFGFGTGACGPA